MGEAKRRKMVGEYPEYTGKPVGYKLCGCVAVHNGNKNFGAITMTTLLVPTERFQHNNEIVSQTIREDVLKQKLLVDFPNTRAEDWSTTILIPKIEQTEQELKNACDLVAKKFADIYREDLRNRFGDKLANAYTGYEDNGWKDVWAENAVSV